MTIVYVALGGNTGDPATTIAQALQELDALPGSRVQDSSPLYRTAPVGPQAQPHFINAVTRLETTLPAITLLRHMQEIEYRHGRRREQEQPWGPRTLDLDLLLYGRQCIDQEQLTVPHPEMANRAFVLKPLLDVAADDLDVPGLGRVRELLGHVDVAGVARIEA